MIPHSKNAVIVRVHVVFVVTGEQINLTKIVGLQNTKISQQSTIEDKKMNMRGTSIYPMPSMRGLAE